MTILSRAEDVAKALSDRIQTISVANGFETDIGLRVFRGRRSVDEDHIPCAVIIEGADKATGRPGRVPTAEITQPYTVVAYVPCDEDHPNDAAHAAIRDIKRAIFSGAPSWSTSVKTVDYRGRDIGPRADTALIVFASVDIEVVYVEDLTNP